MNSLKDWVEVDVEGSSQSSKANHIAPGVGGGVGQVHPGGLIETVNVKAFDWPMAPN